jgi:hypothetical protein
VWIGASANSGAVHRRTDHISGRDYVIVTAVKLRAVADNYILVRHHLDATIIVNDAIAFDMIAGRGDLDASSGNGAAIIVTMIIDDFATSAYFDCARAVAIDKAIANKRGKTGGNTIGSVTRCDTIRDARVIYRHTVSAVPPYDAILNNESISEKPVTDIALCNALLDELPAVGTANAYTGIGRRHAPDKHGIVV